MASRFSLRKRLTIFFIGIMGLGILLVLLSGSLRHRIAVRGAQIALQGHTQMVNLVQLRELFVEIGRQTKRGQTPSTDLAHAQKWIARVRMGMNEAGDRKVLDQLEERFNAFVQALVVTD